MPKTDNICSHFFSRHSSSERSDYTILELQQNAIKCDLCATVLAGLSTVMAGSLDLEYHIVFKVKHRDNIPPRLTYWKQGNYSTKQRFELSPVSENNSLPTPICDIEPFQDIAPDSSSQACIQRIEFWMRNCKDVHPYCSEDTTAALPKRVLDVTSLRLYESNGEKDKYVALSHCWGTSISCKTEKTNIAQRYSGIPWGKLPKTFQDAITVTRALGIQYLWIDSLCIIQDDQNDWETESVKMDRIYKNSHLTIAASLAHGDHEGFLRPRTEYLTSIVTTQLANNIMESFKIRPLPAKHYRRDVGPRNRSWRNNMTVPGAPPQPLETRAWCFQERLVSQRIVSFCDTEMEWDCMSLSRCECETRLLVHDENFDRVLQGMELVPGKSSIRSLYQSLLCLAEDLGDDKQENLKYLQDIVRKHWHELLVPSYSLLKLTKPNDRLLALSAVASELKNVLSDDYLAGNWRADLARSISWIARSFGTMGPQPGWQPHIYRAPSWSWASIEGAVDSVLVINANVIYCVDIKDAQCTPATNDLFGLVTDGYIKVRGNVIQTQLTVPAINEGDVESDIKYKLSTQTGLSLASSFFPDTPLIECQVDNTKTIRRAHLQPGDARTSIDAQVICLVIGGEKSYSWKSRGFQLEESEREITDVEKLEEARFDNVILMALGKSAVTAGAYERLGVAEGVSWKDCYSIMSEMDIIIV